MSSILSARVAEDLAARVAADGRSVRDLIVAGLDVAQDPGQPIKRITLTIDLVPPERGSGGVRSVSD